MTLHGEGKRVRIIIKPEWQLRTLNHTSQSTRSAEGGMQTGQISKTNSEVLKMLDIMRQQTNRNS